jgi:hypothetical protein
MSRHGLCVFEWLQPKRARWYEKSLRTTPADEWHGVCTVQLLNPPSLEKVCRAVAASVVEASRFFNVAVRLVETRVDFVIHELL